MACAGRDHHLGLMSQDAHHHGQRGGRPPTVAPLSAPPLGQRGARRLHHAEMTAGARAGEQGRARDAAAHAELPALAGVLRNKCVFMLEMGLLEGASVPGSICLD